VFNDAARTHCFTPCAKLTPPMRKRLERRLGEIGGLAEFARAVAAVPLHDFLAGRVRQGDRKPFKLDLEQLLRTEGKMGDILVLLLGLADEGARSRGAADDIEAQREFQDTLARLREEDDGRC
jgi:hypothetical protein